MKSNRTHPKKFTIVQIAVYFVITFAITWSMFFLGINVFPEQYEIFFIIIAAFGPLAAALIVIRVYKGKIELRKWIKQIFRFRIPIFSYIAGAFIIPIAIGLLQYLFYILLGGKTDFSQAMPWYLYLFNLIPTALLTGGNEEPGWRGFALPALLDWFHPIIASLILGVIHGAWHLPLMERYNTTFGWYLFNILPLTFFFNWFYIRWPKSIFPIMLFHAGTNVIGNFIPTPTIVLGGMGTWMFLRGVVYWAIVITILILTKGNLGYKDQRAG